MIKIISTIVFILLINTDVFSQTRGEKRFVQIDNNEVDGITIETIADAEIKFACNPNSKLITSKGLDYFLASRISYISLGEKDLSFFKTYFLADAVNGSFLLGKNLNLKSTENGFSNMLNVALAIKVTDNEVPVFAEGDFSSGIKLNFSYTNFGLGKISFNGNCNPNSQKGKMNKFLKDEVIKRIINRDIKMNELDKNIAALKKVDAVNSLKYDNYATKEEEEINKDIFEDIYEKEAKYLEKTGQFNMATVWWWTAGASLPLTKSDEYAIIDSAYKKIGEYNYRKWNAFLKINKLIVYPKSNFLFQISPNAYYTNNLLESKIKLNMRKSFKILSNNPDTLFVKELEDDKGYLNSYKSFFTLSMGLKIVYQYVKMDEFAIGADFEARASRNEKLDLFFGIPISLKGKDDKFLNFEPYIFYSDALKSNNKLITTKNSLTLGIRIGLPFSNFIK